MPVHPGGGRRLPRLMAPYPCQSTSRGVQRVTGLIPALEWQGAGRRGLATSAVKPRRPPSHACLSVRTSTTHQNTHDGLQTQTSCLPTPPIATQDPHTGSFWHHLTSTTFLTTTQCAADSRRFPFPLLLPYRHLPLLSIAHVVTPTVCSLNGTGSGPEFLLSFAFLHFLETACFGTLPLRPSPLSSSSRPT
jgi:hypothetical protein